jgi:hypothetical protein
MPSRKSRPSLSCSTGLLFNPPKNCVASQPDWLL